MSAGSRNNGFGRPVGYLDDRGSLTVFSLFVIIIMLVVGGMAVDFMRQETARAQFQSTLDRAILAAADMDQTMDPKTVVDDYFAKSGLTGYSLNVNVSDGFSARRVSATGNATLPAFFLHFLGINSLAAPAAGTAEESIDNIEISLVLDVSGSMGQTSASGKTKIAELKTAAKQFVDTIYAQTDPSHTSISIVPYSTQVNLGPELASKFNLSNDHAASFCVDFDKADYDVAAITTTEPLAQTAHFDPISGSGTKSPRQWVCRTDSAMQVLPVTNTVADLKAKIDSLAADGYTSIEIGVKWGTALLDPAARPAVDGLVADNVVDASLKGRPLDYDPARTKKVIVVLTDGINTNQWLVDPRYRSGPSQVWKDPATGTLSYKGPLGNYYVPGKGFQAGPVGGTAAQQLSYPQLWATVGVNWNAARMADTLSGGNSTLWNQTYALWTTGLFNAVTGILTPGAYSVIGGTEKDTRLQAMCSAAKAQGILIYSIGFEVTAHSADEMAQCATLPSYFFRVDGVSIATAFNQIANDIGKLRLTQ